MNEVKYVLKGDRGTGGLTVLCKECHNPIEYIKRGEKREPKSAYCELHIPMVDNLTLKDYSEDLISI